MEFSGQKIKELRRTNKVKQYDLALLVGVPASALCNWENGKRSPTAANLMKLSKALDVDPGYFFV
jgi:transcriptional regulator with XRE-family HTH domain